MLIEENNEGVTLEDQDQSQSEITPSDEGQQDQGQEPSDTQGDQGVTDKGSQGSQEPQSPYYQRIKNENAQLRRLLSDPEQLKEYLASQGHNAPSKENQVNEEEEIAKIAREVVDENNMINLPKLVKALEDRTIKKVDNLVSSYSNTTKTQITNKIQYDSDLKTVLKDHPELDPNSGSYNQEYNEIVGNIFLAKGGVQGKVRLTDVAKSFFTAINSERKKGSQQAQQQIIRKKAGGIQQNANAADSSQQQQEQELTPEASIAQKFRQAAGIK